MIQKTIVYAILVSMALHCGCRLGLLDQLFQKRHEIAYAIGLIEEIPIALCSSDYEFNTGLKIETHDDFPSIHYSMVHAKDISPFFISRYELHRRQERLLADSNTTSYPDLYRLVLVSPIFHPPSFLS